MVKILVKNGADVNQKKKDPRLLSDEGPTSLGYVAKEGELEIVKFLVENGADVNAKNENGKTALQLADDNSNVKVVNYLKSKGAQ